ncbi:hypothetical protein AB0O20_09765 [Streptomyces kronopolitis]|uniref:hypothetical protein n=1 Tax=Streptomyces kronopolitis TaxID=1612435 RepID=UPI00342648F8
MRKNVRRLTLVAAIGGLGLLAVPVQSAAAATPASASAGTARVECAMSWKGGSTVTYWADASQGCWAGGTVIATSP